MAICCDDTGKMRESGESSRLPPPHRNRLVGRFMRGMPPSIRSGMHNFYCTMSERIRPSKRRAGPSDPCLRWHVPDRSRQRWRQQPAPRFDAQFGAADALRVEDPLGLAIRLAVQDPVVAPVVDDTEDLMHHGVVAELPGRGVMRGKTFAVLDLLRLGWSAPRQIPASPALSGAWEVV